jgi:hypothetical protein
LWGFEERGQSWRARILSNELRGSIFIEFGSVIYTLEFSSKFGNVMHKLAWACTGPWSNPIWSKCNWNDVGMKLEWQGNVMWSFEVLIFTNDACLLTPCAALANLIQNEWIRTLWKS